MKIPKKILYFTKYLTDTKGNKEFIKEILIKKGKKLVIAPTGGGKTYSFVNTMKEISSEYSNKVFIIACPNRIQNLQNQKSYKITALVGGQKVDETITIASMVYDKANEIAQNYYLTKNKEITLVIDEAHQLIYSKKFRSKAINNILELEKKCFNVIHLTATPRALTKCYNYDEINSFVPFSDTNNIKKFAMIETDNKLSGLIQTIDSIIQSKGKILLYINNKEKARAIINTLEKVYKDKNIDFINSDNKKSNTTFNSIVEFSLIPENIDILVSTSLIECGTNILNENFYPVMFVDNKKFFSIDSAIQFFARIRNEIELGILIYQKSKEKPLESEDNYIYGDDIYQQQIALDVDKVFEIELEIAKEKIKKVNKLMEVNMDILGSREEAEELGKLILTSKKIDSTFGKGYIYIDEEDGMAKLDIELFTKYCFEKADTSLFNDYELLLNELKKGIKSSKLLFGKNNTTSELAKEIEEKEKQANAEIKEQREELKFNFLELIKDNYNKEIFTDYLKAEHTEKDLYKSAMKSDFKNVVEYLETDKKLLNEIKKKVRKYNSLGDEKVLNILIDNELDDFQIRKEIYLLFNKSDDFIKTLDTDYSIIRNILDKKIQKKLSDTTLFALYKTLNPRTKAKKLLPRTREKLLIEINLIYNVSSYDNKLKINSLKK